MRENYPTTVRGKRLEAIALQAEAARLIQRARELDRAALRQESKEASA